MVTNEAFASVLQDFHHGREDDGLPPNKTPDCQEAFPAFVEETDGVAAAVLAPLNDRNLSNHVGITTLGLTSDGHLILFRQASWNQQGGGMAVATGSGSVDYADIAEAGSTENLLPIIQYSMARELTEESSLKEDDQVMDVRALSEATHVVGFFRWVDRCGKPEFVGVTRLPKDRHHYSADMCEVWDDLESEPIHSIRRMSDLGIYRNEYLRLLQEDMEREPNLRCMRKMHLSTAVGLDVLCRVSEWEHQGGIFGDAYAKLKAALFGKQS